jgi:hypothetical protein
VSVRGKTIEDEVVREFSCGLLGSMGDLGTETKACCTLGGRRWDSVCQGTDTCVFVVFFIQNRLWF